MNTPPKSGGKKTKQGESTVCLVCDTAIVEQNANTNPATTGEDAVFCEGSCQGWIHRTCAGLTKKAYDILSESDEPYFCAYCMSCKQNTEINNLKSLVKSLTDELPNLKSTIDTLRQTVEEQHNDIVTLQGRLSAEGQPSTLNPQLPSATSSPDHSTSLPPHRGASDSSKTHTTAQVFPKGILPSKRKFNVVVHGVKEAPQATPRYQRHKSDLNESLSILSIMNNEINPQSVRDCFRLGKFRTQSTRPRPILVKLNRAVDVTTVLSNRAQTPKGRPPRRHFSQA